MDLAAAQNAPMLVFRYLPEIAAFFLFLLVSVQAVDGPYLILTEFALTGLLIITQPKTFMDTILRWWPLLATPLLAMASSFWSAVPDVSLRYSAQLLFTVFLGVFLARLLSPQRWLWVFMASTLVFCLLSIASGRQGPSDVGVVLVGLTGSKNAMSAEGQLLLMSSAAALLMAETPRPLRLAALAGLLIGLVVVAITNSATGAILTFGGVVALLVLWLSEGMTPGSRLVTLVLGAAMAAPLLLLLPELSALWDHFLYDTLNKDPTLTGRTVLWARADDLIAHRPLFGYGYQAIWMGQSSDTIALQRLTGITDGRTFHFHNTFRQVAVDTGLVGLVIFAGAMLVTFVKDLAQVLLRPSVATSFMFVAFLLIFLRANTESVLMPFLNQTLILYSCSVYAFWRPDGAPRSAPRPIYNQLRPAGVERPA